MTFNLHERDSNESVWHPELQELHIDFSPLLNSPCTLILTGWNRGISWSVIVDGETELHCNPFEDSLFQIEFIDHQCLKQWAQTIPTKVLNLLRQYKGNTVGMLNILSRHDAALNLFVKHPAVFWLLFRHAEKNGWLEAQFISGCKHDPVALLGLCHLPPTTTALKVLNNIREPYGHDQQLIEFLLRHPHWLDSELMVNWKQHSIPQLLELVYSIKQLAGILRLDSKAIMQQVYDCPNLEAVELLHGQLQQRRTNQLTWLAMDDNKSALDTK